MLAELPHFNNARRYVAPLLIIGAVFAALGLALTGAISAHANAYWRLDLPIPRSLGFLGASFLVAAAGFLSSGLLVFVRLRLLEQEPLADIEPEPGADRGAGARRQFARWRQLLHARASRLVWRDEILAGWPQALVALLFAGLGDRRRGGDLAGDAARGRRSDHPGDSGRHAHRRGVSAPGAGTLLRRHRQPRCCPTPRSSTGCCAFP